MKVIEEHIKCQQKESIVAFVNVKMHVVQGQPQIKSLNRCNRRNYTEIVSKPTQDSTYV